MLKKILSGKTCASCRVCCAFYKEELWEMPSISDELKTLIKEKYNIETEYRELNGNRVFWADFDENNLLYCPMLGANALVTGDSGCILGDDKPFECRVWPFRSMSIKDENSGKDKIVITVSPLCGEISSMPNEQLREFAKTELKEVFIEKIQKEPKLIKPYIEGYTIVLEL